MSLYPFHLGQIISTVLGQVDHGVQDANAARTQIRDETSETDHTQKRRFRHGAICRTIKALAILRCLYGSEIFVKNIHPPVTFPREISTECFDISTNHI